MLRVLRRVVSPQVQCVQRAGELMYVPEGWWHATMNNGDTLAVALQTCVLSLALRTQLRSAQLASLDRTAQEHGAGPRDGSIRAETAQSLFWFLVLVLFWRHAGKPYRAPGGGEEKEKAVR